MPATAWYTLTLEVRARDAEALGGLLMELGAGAVEERTRSRRSTLVVHAPSRRELSALALKARPVLAGFALPPGAVRIERAPSFDWALSFQMKPRVLTPRLRVEPVTGAEPAGRSGVIRLHPGLAFGDGSHPTTRLAARAVERLCRREPRLQVLDVGTGSGVLSFVAAKSGAARVLGIDTDPVALGLARQNALENELGCAVSFRARLPRPLPVFDLVVANLEPRVLVASAARIARAAAGARWLIVTGFLSSQDQMVRAAFEREGLVVRGRAEEEGWLQLLLSAAPRGRSGSRKRPRTS
jgi:ribosomal protein L11 methyltransferase